MGEWSHFPCEGMARKSEKGHPTTGVPVKGMSGREHTGRGGVPGGRVRPPEGPGNCKPQVSGSGAVGQGSDMVGVPSSC